MYPNRSPNGRGTTPYPDYRSNVPGTGTNGQQLGGTGESSPQEAAEQRAIYNELQRKKRQEERAERERLEKERAVREEAARKEQREKAVLANQQKERARELERKKKVRETWDKSPSRSRSHQSPPPGAGRHERMAQEENRRVPGLAKKKSEKKPTSPDTIDILDEDEELQLALQASLQNSQPPNSTSTSSSSPSVPKSPEVHDVDDYDSEGEGKFYEDDEDLQRALMLSAAEKTTPSSTSSIPSSSPSHPSSSSPSHSPPSTTITSTHSITYPPSSLPQNPPQPTTSSFSFTPYPSSSFSSHPPSSSFSSPSSSLPPVYDVDGDVDMEIGEDPELQDALMRSLDTRDAKPPAQTQRTGLPDKETSRRTRIFGENSRPVVYGVDEEEGRGGEAADRELQDALRLSRQVIDVDQQGEKGREERRGRAEERRGEFGGAVEDYPSPTSEPIITSAEGGGIEDEDEELQRALMSSLNPNASPATERITAHAPASAPAQMHRFVPRVPVDPAVANARRLRNEQDRAYQESLAEDREKERKAKEAEEVARKQKEEEEKAAKLKEMEETARRELRGKAGTLLPPEPKEGQGITIGIKMPNNTRHMRRFNPTDTLQDLRNFIESKANEANLSQDYEISSDFPKKTFHDLPSSQTLAEAGISGRMLLIVHEI